MNDKILEFEEKFDILVTGMKVFRDDKEYICVSDMAEFKHFLSKALTTQSQQTKGEIREAVEKMEKIINIEEDESLKENKLIKKLMKKAIREWKTPEYLKERRTGWNQAITDILSLLK